MLHRSLMKPTGLPGRPVRVLIEGADLTVATPADVVTVGMDVRLCSGPTEVQDQCPLVVDGVCPLGQFDVVVSTMGAPWGESVREAWARQGVVVAQCTRSAGQDAADWFNRCLGAGVGALYRRQYGEPDD